VYESNRNLATVLALGAVTVAVLGYLVGARASAGGHGHAATPAVHLSPAFGSSVVLETPSGWKQAVGAPGLPGLTIAHTTAFAPGGDARTTGLLTGTLAGGEPTPLPAAFVGLLRAIPRAQVVTLGQIEAYRYSDLSVRGYGELLTIYAIPTPRAGPMLLACYAADAAAMRTCEEIVASLRLVGRVGVTGLSPDPAYALDVSATVGRLDAQRVALRRSMRSGASLVAVAQLATSLSTAFAATNAAMAHVVAPLAATQAQASLSRALQRARDAYSALAAAAGHRDLGAYEAARARVYEAEAAVDGSLESFSLLGYGRP
jgi:hypothetical protein